MATVLTECPEVPRTWDEPIETYLSDHNIACEKATPLTGGNSAYIWRLDGFKKDGQTHGRSVFKYADTEIKGMVDMEVPAGRMLTEIRALNTTVVQKACEQVPYVQIPTVLQTTEEGFVMSWAGEVDLRTAFIQNKDLDAEALGLRLGKWLASLHVAAVGDPGIKTWTNALIEGVVEREAAHLRTGFRERGIHDDVTERAVALLQQPGPVQTLTVCDFRPMNTLLSSKDSVDATATVVDWECARYGDPAFDIRLWAAEAMVMESKYGDGRGLLRSFLQGYVQYAGPEVITSEFVCRVAVVMGSILFWLMPLGIWDVTDEAEGEQWRLLAVEYIRAGANRDMAWLSKSVLSPLLANVAQDSTRADRKEDGRLPASPISGC
ncbi:hypothetical protein CLAFUW4_07102 [Fulvia fulva]|uniref:Aminoglycoside phosphotransferase domain-containing protein n=1 Tax=Passalora fulva TaxID=5499 RepID=A0A9Q8UR36_PASFU|nr:uncharacterized protein CLAFUR5_07236 [Fulvia fulva]KAK4622131.1 hypothetical protein CLAFUR4_07111 [Fulvia fulva]KAK4623451.1 hypothetical protein CLAFUR0_07109 [Fulvia fulva]UJO19343.1 hypothetical protein CLAFUR5_07236 [Fulvia fulva]WPV15769.1 hypothetical protein CLAFUW4_07102 [Fulvia fulva]WPV31226.1 hypothetical protein CLAFUW7_07102 [Fulvia fulva]